MKKIKNLEKEIVNILIMYPDTRDDDYLLFYRLCLSKNIDVTEISVSDFLQHRKTLGFPNWETVGRVRRKLQEKYASLRSEKYKYKQSRQKAFKEYANEN